MIFELANAVQVFLHDHNKPGTKSFYEEMLLLKKEKEKEEQKKKNKAVCNKTLLKLLFNCNSFFLETRYVNRSC